MWLFQVSPHHHYLPPFAATSRRPLRSRVISFITMSHHDSEMEMDSSPAPASLEYPRVNPFETCVLRNLKFTTWSPSVMNNVNMSTPTSTSSSEFKGWDVAELSALFPKALKESPSSHTNPYPVDSSDEARAQADIDEFFSRGPIAPTPDDVPKQRNFLFRETKKAEITHSWTNTELSFPVDLPPELEIALKPYFQVTVSSESQPIYEECAGEDEDEEEEEDVFNNSNSGQSSLRADRSKHMPARRKLELSFGEPSSPCSPIPLKMMKYGDPFTDNHRVESPDLDTTAEFTARFERCEFTPKSRNGSNKSDPLRTPDLTPIRGSN